MLNTIPDSCDKLTIEDSSPKDVLEEIPDVDSVADKNQELNEDLANTVEETEPTLMSEDEKEAFLKEIFAKVDKAIETMWRPGLDD